MDPGAADAQLAELQGGVCGGQHHAVLEHLRHHILDLSRRTEAVIVEAGGADREGVPVVGGELHAGHEQHVVVTGLGRREDVEVRHGVVLGEHHEVEPGRPGDVGDGIEGRPTLRVAAVPAVHMEVSGVPPGRVHQRGCGDVGPQIGLGRQRGRLRKKTSSS